MEENKFKCSECKKYYKSYQSLWNHKKRIHDLKMTDYDHNSIKTHDQTMTENDPIKKIKKTDNSTCEYCNKILSAYTHLRRHLKICKTKQDIIKQNEAIIKQQNEIIKQNNEIIKQNEEIINKTSTALTTTNNNTMNNNTNNGTINNTNNINIFHYGTETIIDNLPDNEAIKLLKIGGFKALIEAFMLTHFSKNHPEGHNLLMNETTDKFVSVFDKKKGKMIVEPTEDALDHLLGQRRFELEELLYKHKDELNELELYNLNNVVDIQIDCPQHIIDKAKKIAVKYKEMVKQTIEKVIGN
jgi:hypothetical protein